MTENPGTEQTSARLTGSRAWARRVQERVSHAISPWPRPLRLLLLGIMVGVVSGLGAILFDALLRLALEHFIRLPTGYAEPARNAAPD